jgi:hypothetical protein
MFFCGYEIDKNNFVHASKSFDPSSLDCQIMDIKVQDLTIN